MAGRMLVRMPNWLGDSIMCLPALEALHKLFPDEKITILCRDSLATLFDRFPYVNKTILFNRQTEAAVHKALDGKGYGRLVLFTNSIRSSINGIRTGVPLRQGYGNIFRSLLLTESMPPDNSLHMVDYYLKLLLLFSEQSFSREVAFPLMEQEQTFAGQIGSLNSAVAIPLGAKYGGAKVWPMQRLEELLQMLMSRTERDVLLFGTAAEVEQAGKLASINSGRIKNMAGKTSIGQMAALINRCEVAVANDSGVLHLAAAVGLKVIALFGSTDHSRTCPVARGVKVVRKNVECAPCLRRECNRDFSCMMDITAEEIFGLIDSPI